MLHAYSRLSAPLYLSPQLHAESHGLASAERINGAPGQRVVFFAFCVFVCGTYRGTFRFSFFPVNSGEEPNAKPLEVFSHGEDLNSI